jgi:tetratricopeptide (TPR) repeat protein
VNRLELRQLAQDRLQDAAALLAAGRWSAANHLDKLHAPGVPQVETLRRGLRKDILAFYEGIARVEEDAGPTRRLEAAQAYMLMADIQEPQAGIARLEHARSLLDKLLAEEPNNKSYQSELGRCFTLLSNFAGTLGRLDECLAFRQKALTVFEELGRALPESADVQRSLALCHGNLGDYYETTGNLPKMEHHFQQAVGILEELTRQHPEEDWYGYYLAVSYTNMALLYCSTQRLEKSFPLYARAESRLSSLVQAHPEEKRWAFTLVQTLRLWGSFLIWAGRGEEARPILTRAVTLMDTLVREDPTSAMNREMLLGCLAARMNGWTQLHRRAEGEADWKRCVELAAALGSWDYPCEGARGNAMLGAHTLAAAQADWLLKQKGITSANRYELVRAYALATSAAMRDSRLAVTQQKTTTERYALAAMALLEQLAKQGHFQTPQSRSQLRKGEPDLELLRTRLDFQKLLAKLPD